MKKWIVLMLMISPFSINGYSQVSDIEISLLQKLDSVQQSNSIARHFAGLYFETTVRAVDFFEQKGQKAKNFIERLETRFAGYFFRSAEAFHKGTTIPAEWRTYFSDTSLSPLQYQLLGINAHINGDIWQALTAEFSWQEIQENKKSYFDFHKALIKQYQAFYERSVSTNATTRLLHAGTLGLDKWYGKMMLGRWRKRQMELARLHFTDTSGFDKKIARLRQKMIRLDRLVLRHL